MIQHSPGQFTNCWSCRYFKITHDIARPYGCAAMGFKATTLPCIEVMRIEGTHCLSFLPKIASTNVV